MSKLSLDTSAMQDDFFADTSLVGIVSAAQGYRLCWLLNDYFDIELIRDPEQNIVFQKKDQEFHFPVYCCELPNCSYRHLLYKLKNGKETLLPEVKQLDYLWLVQTADPESDARRFARGLRDIPDVQLARILNISELKNVKNLIL